MSDVAITRRALLAVLAGSSVRSLSPPAAPAVPGPSSPRLLTPTEDRGQAPDPGPRILKAVYLSYYGVGDPTIRGRVFDLLDRTELNAVVIDVKGDEGFLPSGYGRRPIARSRSTISSAGYVSDGDPNTVAIPRGRRSELREDLRHGTRRVVELD